MHRDGREKCKERGKEIQRKNFVFSWNINERIKLRNGREDLLAAD